MLLWVSKRIRGFRKIKILNSKHSACHYWVINSICHCIPTPRTVFSTKEKYYWSTWERKKEKEGGMKQGKGHNNENAAHWFSTIKFNVWAKFNNHKFTEFNVKFTTLKNAKVIEQMTDTELKGNLGTMKTSFYIVGNQDISLFSWLK